MKCLLYHPTGNQNVRAALRSLSNKGMLHSFHTTIAVFTTEWFYKFLKFKFSILRKRTFPDSIKDKTCTYPILETLMYMGVKKIGSLVLTPNTIDKWISKRIANKILKMHDLPNMIYCYPGNSSMIMEAAHKRNIRCVYELTTAYYQHVLNLYKHESDNNKDWYETISFYRKKEIDNSVYDTELMNADYIVCASSYIKRTLCEFGYSDKPIKVIPYGFPKVRKKQFTANNNVLKVLFVGSLSQSKGISYMFDAVDALSDKVRLSLIGSLPSSCDIIVRERIKKYNYLGTLCHDDVLDEMHKADILLFPTLSDGYGMVASEAMSQGTPIIATENSCAIDIINNGVNGWIIPVQNTNAIIDVLNRILNNRELLQTVSLEALETARNRPWAKYEEELSDYLLSVYNH